MDTLTKNDAPRYKRDNITSYLLVSKRTCDSGNLAVTLVEMEPGGVQHIHDHKPEQMYYILEGSGVMTVDDERKHGFGSQIIDKWTPLMVAQGVFVWIPWTIR